MARDTLFGGLWVDIGGTSAEVSIYSRATQHNAAATVDAWAYPDIAVGYEFPQSVPAIYCPEIPPSNGQGYVCSRGQAYEVNCRAPGGSRIDVISEHNGRWTNGARGFGTLRDEKQCLPTGGGVGGGGGDDGGDGRSCTTYIIEQSDDGGNTWYEVGRYTVCD